MAYIAPNSTIILCANVPLDNTYKHSIIFSTPTAQNAYFRTKAIQTLFENSYQRVERGKMRVALCADDIYNCNYLMFRNTSFGEKWFYCFVTGVEYINNVTSEITFEIDSLQTYLFNTTLLQCYVEREHSSFDTIGYNIVPEPIETPELCIYDLHTRYWNHGNYNVKIQIKPSAYQTWATGDLMCDYEDNQVVPHTITELPMNTPRIDADLRDLTSKGGDVVNAYEYPYEFDDDHPDGIDVDYDLTRPTNFKGYATGESDYTPHNKKLFTFPYIKLTVESTQGSSCDYSWENSNQNKIAFKLYGVSSNQPYCELRPSSYYNQTGVRNNSVELSDFPQVTFNTYPSLSALSLAQSAIKVGTSLVTKTPYGITQSVSEALNIFSDRGTNTPGTTGPNLDLKYDSLGFLFYRMALRAADAKIIDHFFDMYGYATKQIKVPNRDVRPHWCYCKTKDCVVKSNAPADDVRKICSIYDNGITWWKNGNEVGDYSLDNTI